MPLLVKVVKKCLADFRTCHVVHIRSVASVLVGTTGPPAQLQERRSYVRKNSGQVYNANKKCTIAFLPCNA